MTTHSRKSIGLSGFPHKTVMALCGAKVPAADIQTSTPVDCRVCRALLELEVHHFNEMIEQHPGSRSYLLQGRQAVQRLLG